MLVADGILLLLWIDFFLHFFSFPKITVDRAVSKSRFFVQEPFHLILHFSNPTPVNFQLGCIPTTKGLGKLIQVFHFFLPSSKSHCFTFTGYYFDRGKKVLGNTSLSYTGLFGLYKLFRSISFQEDMLVFPLFPAVTFEKEALRDLLPGRKTTYRMLEDPTYIKNVRDYDREPIQRIHWKISAKMDHLMVKEFEFTAIGSIKIILDLNLPSSIYAKEVWSRFRKDYEKYAVEAVGSIIQYIKTAGVPLELTILGKEIWTVPKTAKDFVYYIEQLVHSEGTDQSIHPLDEILKNMLPTIQFSDTVILFCMHLTEEDVPQLLQIRKLSSKVIAFLLPYGFRNEKSIPRDSYMSIHPDVQNVLKRASLLAENQIHVEFINENNSLQEAIHFVP